MPILGATSAADLHSDRRTVALNALGALRYRFRRGERGRPMEGDGVEAGVDPMSPGVSGAEALPDAEADALQTAPSTAPYAAPHGATPGDAAQAKGAARLGDAEALGDDPMLWSRIDAEDPPADGRSARASDAARSGALARAVAWAATLLSPRR